MWLLEWLLEWLHHVINGRKVSEGGEFCDLGLGSEYSRGRFQVPYTWFYLVLSHSNIIINSDLVLVGKYPNSFTKEEFLFIRWRVLVRFWKI